MAAQSLGHRRVCETTASQKDNSDVEVSTYKDGGVADFKSQERPWEKQD